MKTQTLDEWQAEMQTLFPEGAKTVCFVCPQCGLVTSIGDFIAADADPECAPKYCIGNFKPDVGCDWKAFGLLGTFGKGRRINLPSGKQIEVFEFAATGATAAA